MLSRRSLRVDLQLVISLELTYRSFAHTVVQGRDRSGADRVEDSRVLPNSRHNRVNRTVEETSNFQHNTLNATLLRETEGRPTEEAGKQ